jgi:hypothetical protein
VSDEADNLVIRHLQGLRADMAEGFRGLRKELLDRLDRVEDRQVKTEVHLADLRGLVLDTRAEIGRQVEDLRAEVRGSRVAERLAAVEGKIADIERRLGI